MKMGESRKERKRKVCCCCIETKTATFAVAFVEIAFYGIFCVTSLALLFVFHSSDQELDLSEEVVEKDEVKPNNVTWSEAEGNPGNLTEDNRQDTGPSIIALRWFYILLAFMQIVAGIILLVGVLKRSAALLVIWLCSKILWLILYRIFRHVYYGASFIQWTSEPGTADSDLDLDVGPHPSKIPEVILSSEEISKQNPSPTSRQNLLNELHDDAGGVTKGESNFDGVKFVIFFATLYFMFVVSLHLGELWQRNRAEGGKKGARRKGIDNFGEDEETQPMCDL